MSCFYFTIKVFSFNLKKFFEVSKNGITSPQLYDFSSALGECLNILNKDAVV